MDLIFDMDEVTEDPWEFASDNGVRVLSHLDWLAGYADSRGLAAVLFAGISGDEYEFDIAVAPRARRQGLAGKLMDLAIENYEDMLEPFPDLVFSLDVVSPISRRMLEQRGFRVVGGTEERPLMSRNPAPELDLREKPMPVHAEEVRDFIPDADVAEGFFAGRWHVVSAPRPIPGDVEWRGGGGAGYFFAAMPVNPDESDLPEIYDWKIDQWRVMHAQPLVVFTEEEIWQRLLEDFDEDELEEMLEFMPTPREWGGPAEARGLPTPLRMPG